MRKNEKLLIGKSTLTIQPEIKGCFIIIINFECFFFDIIIINLFSGVMKKKML